LQKPTGQLLADMQANLYEICTVYLLNILFATLNNLNLKIHHIIDFNYIEASMFSNSN